MGEIHRDQYVSTVRANVPLCSEHYRLVLQLPEFPPTEPGQFIQISCRDLDVEYGPEHELIEQDGGWSKPIGMELQAPLAMIRRPFSLAGRRDADGHVELDIIHRVVGVGTEWMSKLQVGDRVHILGPLGNRFTLPEQKQQAILVGGGVGIPPMLYLAERLADRSAVAFCGALRRDLLPLTIRECVRTIGDANPREDIVEFARHGVASVITTDDGSYGFRGFVTQALEQYLDEQSSRGPNNPKPIIYTCGPEPMMKRVADIANARGIECQIAVERAMACGMGTCQSCCIKVRRPVSGGRDWAYRLACTDGPVFRGAELLW